MPRHIPIEIYPLIFQHIASNAALSKLCTVSRAFRHEAQWILYHTVRLPPDYDCMTSWCHAIIENPGLAMHVYALYLPTTLRHNPLLKTEIDSMLQKVQQAVKRALFSLSRLAELHTYSSWGRRYLNFDIFCGHPFHLQVFAVELNPPGTLEHCLKFLSEQPRIRHWRLNVLWGNALDPDVLPLLTSAHIHSSALNIITRCPMIRALRIERRSSGEFCDELLTLKAFRHTLAGLSIGCFHHLAIELTVVRDTVPNIEFLGLRPEYGLQIFDPSANLLTGLAGFPHLTTLVFELPPGVKNQSGWPADSEEGLSLAAGLMNANATLRRVAFEVRCSWTNGRWPCYVRASGACGNSTAVFEGFDILGHESWRDV